MPPIGQRMHPWLRRTQRAPTTMQRILDAVERVGNKVPHPVIIFVILIGIVIVLSHIFYMLGLERLLSGRSTRRPHEVEDATTVARSLLTVDGIRFMFTGVVQNFMNFNAVGVIIVAMVGVGVAEEAGLVKALIRKLVVVAPAEVAHLHPGVRRHPLQRRRRCRLPGPDPARRRRVHQRRAPSAGRAWPRPSPAVAAAFLVNILIVPVDGILTEITNDAIHLVNPAISIDLAANVWFSIASVVMLTIVIALITEKHRRAAPRRRTPATTCSGTTSTLSADEYARPALRRSTGCSASSPSFALLTLPPGAPLRNPETGAIIGNSPFMTSLIVTIALIFLVCGIGYGIGAGTMKSINDVVNAMTKAIASLSGLILLLLVISQFLAYFNYTNMATLAAISLADVLTEAESRGAVAARSASSSWCSSSISSSPARSRNGRSSRPVFMPLLMRLNVEPEAVLAAYRVGDSPMNAITPLNAYFAMIVTFAQKYQKDAGVGTVIALMLPYIVVLCVLWTLLLAAWYLLGLPWGLG